MALKKNVDHLIFQLKGFCNRLSNRSFDSIGLKLSKSQSTVIPFGIYGVLIRKLKFIARFIDADSDTTLYFTEDASDWFDPARVVGLIECYLDKLVKNEQKSFSSIEKY